MPAKKRKTRGSDDGAIPALLPRPDQDDPGELREAVLPGTFEHALSYLIDNEIDLGRVAERFKNDETGAPAYDPAVLLKVVLLAYSRGITSSRTMARACVENVVFIALACDQQPHFTTLAHFIATLGREWKRCSAMC